MGVDPRVSKRPEEISCVFERVSAPKLEIPGLATHQSRAPVEHLHHPRVVVVHLDEELVDKSVRPVIEERPHDVVLVALPVAAA